eukprot:6938290-Lingulodinium_polyedra.AAC.1
MRSKNFYPNAQLERALKSLEEEGQRYRFEHSARDALRGFEKELFASATGWIVEPAPGIHFRYT